MESNLPKKEGEDPEQFEDQQQHGHHHVHTGDSVYSDQPHCMSIDEASVIFTNSPRHIDVDANIINNDQNDRDSSDTA